jgi:hemoglobin/transferrin/lactoferrin receptor protein
VGAETSLSYEGGLRFRKAGVSTTLSVFVNGVHDNIQKQALILPQGAVGLTLGGQPIVAQRPNGTVFVASSTAPVLVRDNFDNARIVGAEHALDWIVTPRWSAGTTFTWLRAEDTSTGLPPNIEGGTPAPEGYLRLTYTQGKRFWVAPYVHAAWRQDRLSSLDIEDRRTGAMRSRANIRAFFLNGATARGWVSSGADGMAGTADDVLRATGETLEQIQNRVLGPDDGSAPLFTSVPGYVTFNMRAGVRLADTHELVFDLENLTDRNYRGISWGVDGPGFGVTARYRATF